MVEFDNFIQVDYITFAQKLKEAKATIDKEDTWRLDLHDAKHYEKINAKCFITPVGSTVAIAEDGDIISVCHHEKDGNIRGKDLIKFAISQGGIKLDCYEGIKVFYEKCGFVKYDEWEWNPQYAPPDWDPNYCKEENVILLKIPINCLDESEISKLNINKEISQAL